MGIRTETILSGWAGGGGLDFGVRLALGDTRTVCYLERDAACIALLVNRMEAGWLDEAPVWTDSRTFDGRAWRGKVSGFIGGPPCQPFSMAGQRRGADDDRNCWPDALRITGELRPEWCFFENVAGSCEYVADFVLPPLEGMGYKVEAGIFSAEEVGAPHLRERLFVLAVAEGVGGERFRGAWDGRARPANGERELADARCGTVREHDSQRRLTEAATGSGGTPMADAGGRQLPQPGRRPDRRARAGQAGAAVGDATHERRTRAIDATDGGGRRTVTGPSNRLPLFPPYRTGDDRWAAVLRDWPRLAPAVESGVCGSSDGMAGLSRAQWLRILGNGVVPLVAAHAFRTLGGRLA